MCKCCQTCLESWYWHCCEKWFCYDENIALWEDPDGSDHNNVGWDNMAYWDSIAVIANRSVVTIQPITAEVKSTPDLMNNDLISQLSLQDDLHRRLSEVFQNSSMLKSRPTEPIGESNRRVAFQLAEDELENNTKRVHNPPINEDRVDSGIEDNEYNIRKETKRSSVKNKHVGCGEINHGFDEAANTLDSKPHTSNYQDNVTKPGTAVPVVSRIDMDRTASPRIPETIKRPSLCKTESSHVFSINMPPLDKRSTELRLIKQNSMPNFYIETPEICEQVPALSADKILMSPVLPNTPKFTYDLRSIVEMEKSKPSTSSGYSHSDAQHGHKSGRLVIIRKKLTPLIIKRPSSRQLTTKHPESNPS